MGFINDKQDLFNEVNITKTMEELFPGFGDIQKDLTSGADSVKSKSASSTSEHDCLNTSSLFLQS